MSEWISDNLICMLKTVTKVHTNKSLVKKTKQIKTYLLLGVICKQYEKTDFANKYMWFNASRKKKEQKEKNIYSQT